MRTDLFTSMKVNGSFKFRFSGLEMGLKESNCLIGMSEARLLLVELWTGLLEGGSVVGLAVGSFEARPSEARLLAGFAVGSFEVLSLIGATFGSFEAPYKLVVGSLAAWPLPGLSTEALVWLPEAEVLRSSVARCMLSDLSRSATSLASSPLAGLSEALRLSALRCWADPFCPGSTGSVGLEYGLAGSFGPR